MKKLLNLSPHIATLLMVVLKLTRVIDWSWWWVLSPMILYTAIVLVVLGVMAYNIYTNIRK